MELPAQSLILTGRTLDACEDWLQHKLIKSDEVIRIEEHTKEGRKTIGIFVDDIRDIQVLVRAHKPHVRVIVVLRDAAKMNERAQNALLKLLEEPRPNLYLVLCTVTPMRLLTTVRSRCQTITLQDTQAAPSLPSEHAARITFMAAGSAAEATKLAKNKRYFEARSHMFEQAKLFVGSSKFERIAMITQLCTDREHTLEFISALQQMYATLLRARYSERLQKEAATLLDADRMVRENNTNVKLQMLRCVV